MFLLFIILVVIIAFVTIPFVYFLADETGKRYFTMFYGLIVIAGGGYSIVYTLFGIVLFLWDFGVGFFEFEPDRSYEQSLKLTLLGIGAVVAIVLLYFAACLVDPGPQKRFLRKNSSREKSK